MDAFESFLQSSAAGLGVSRDNFTLLFLVAASIPLSFPIPYLKPWAKHLYSILSAAFFLTVAFDLKYGYLQLLFMTLSTYGLCKSGVSSPKTFNFLPFAWPWLVFIICMGQLTVNHVYRYINETSLDDMEITGAMMVLVQRLTLFAWTAYDKAEAIDAKSSKETKIAKDEAVELLPFLGFSFFLPSFLVGPGIHYDTYIKRTRAPLPSGRFFAALGRFISGAGFLYAFASTSGQYSYQRILDPEFLDMSPLKQIIFANICGLVARLKYYGIWKVAEAACIVSGVALLEDPNKRWDGAQNVVVQNIEFAPNWKILLDNWNCFTNVWLREAVYKRVTRKGKKPGFKSTMATFGASAFWHGVNVSYYLSFALGGFLQTLAKLMRKNVRPFFLSDAQLLDPKSADTETTPQKAYYDAASIIFTQLTVNYAVVPFMLLDLRATFTAWSRLGFYGHALTFIPLFFFWGGGAKFLSKKIQHRQKKLAEYQKQVPTNEGAKEVTVAGNPHDVVDAVTEMTKEL